MMGKLSGWNDTIAALATPQGAGAIAVIRVSGKDCFAIVNELFTSKNLTQVASHTLHVGLLKFNGEAIDEVVVSVFKNPKSFTGEDVIEISCHGSVHVQQKILDALTSKGARIAKPGEFTMRAFLNGKMDLAQAEAVADLINSNTEISRKTALQNMRGGFSGKLHAIREQMIKFSALIELELDFSQEDVEFADRKQFFDMIEDADNTLQQLLNSFTLGNVIKNGVQVAIIGKPNAGKSTLLNTLLNEERAIVSDIAGTTRDTIEETLNINGILFRLIDTAGIREHTADIIETIGVERSREKMQQADVVLYIFDINTTTTEELKELVQQLTKQEIKFLLIANKADTANESTIAAVKQFSPEVLLISAKEQQNIESIKQTLFNTTINQQLNDKDVIVTNARHIDALKKAAEAITDIRNGLKENLPGDLIALDIRQCLHYLGEITGEITNEDQLDFIFSKFCIGK